MSKQLLLTVVASVMTVINFGGIVSAATHNNNQNHSDYWETATTVCQKTEIHGSQYTFTATQSDVVKVVVKGGPSRVVYSQAPFTDLSAPLNQKSKKTGDSYGISHVIVCVSQDQSEDQTQPTNDQPVDKPNQPVVDKPQHSRPTQTTNNSHKVTICHRTRAVKNPYVMITVDTNAADGIVGHGRHNSDHYGVHKGSVFSSDTDYAPNAKNWGDIIPPVAGAHSGLNWTSEGQAIYNNGCAAAVSNDQPDEDGEVLGEDTTDEGGEILTAASTSRDVAGVQAPTRLPNTGLNVWLALLLPTLAAIPAYPLLRNKA